MKHTIKVSLKHDAHFYATFSDPQVKACMGTDTIVTSFMSPGMTHGQVVTELVKRNPEYTVS